MTIYDSLASPEIEEPCHHEGDSSQRYDRALHSVLPDEECIAGEVIFIASTLLVEPPLHPAQIGNLSHMEGYLCAHMTQCGTYRIRRAVRPGYLG